MTGIFAMSLMACDSRNLENHNSSNVQLTGPKGEKGDQGPQGEQGLPGEKGEQGEKGDTGAQGPQGEQGLPGEKGDKGDTGEKGETGEAGKDGASWLTGEGVPEGSTGKEGDLYLDISTNDIYKKTGETWNKISSLGQKDDGASHWYSGMGAPSESLGSTGSLYMDLETRRIYVKNESGWKKLGMIQEETYAVNLPSTPSGYQISVPKARYAEEETVPVTVTMDSGKYFNALLVDGKPVKGRLDGISTRAIRNTESYTFELSMGSNDMNLSVLISDTAFETIRWFGYYGSGATTSLQLKNHSLPYTTYSSTYTPYTEENVEIKTAYYISPESFRIENVDNESSIHLKIETILKSGKIQFQYQYTIDKEFTMSASSSYYIFNVYLGENKLTAQTLHIMK